MEKGMLTKRFLTEHEIISGLDKELIKNIHRSKRQDVRAIYSYANPAERLLYTVIDTHDRMTLEAFFSDLRIPFNTITEVELQCEGRNDVQDMRALSKAA
jgi:hypothetical protein